MRRIACCMALLRRLSASASASATASPPLSGPLLPTFVSSISSSHLRLRLRPLSSSSGNLCLIQSAEQLSSALNKIQEESSSPAILYFTAAWCGPCRLMSPVLQDLSGKYPNVTTYKIDIDQESLQDKLFELKIDSVPRLHFFKAGKKVDEIIGADIARLKYTMEKLFE